MTGYLMIIPKIKKNEPSDEIIFYGFKDKLLLKQCIAKGCSLLHPDIAFPADDLSNVSFKLMTSFCVEIWRLEKRLKKLRDDNQAMEFGALFDQLQRIQDIFAREGIVIKDYQGEEYKEGISIKALHFETDDTLPKGVSVIVETVRPTVFYKDKVIFHGEVVVAKSA